VSLGLRPLDWYRWSLEAGEWSRIHVVLLAGAGAAVMIAGMTLLCLRLERRLRK